MFFMCFITYHCIYDWTILTVVMDLKFVLEFQYYKFLRINYMNVIDYNRKCTKVTYDIEICLENNIWKVRWLEWSFFYLMHNKYIVYNLGWYHSSVINWDMRIILLMSIHHVGPGSWMNWISIQYTYIYIYSRANYLLI